MDRLGLDHATLAKLNPRLIYASSSGFGRDGPYRAYPAMDLTIQAMTGVMHTTGYADRPPVKAGPAIADFFAGIHLYGRSEEHTSELQSLIRASYAVFLSQQ